MSLELDYCVPRGVPHSSFLGWDPEDQDKALAWLLREKRACPLCGTDPDEWRNADDEFLIPPPYETHEHVCFGCEEIARHERSFEEHGLPRGHTIVLRRTEDPESYIDAMRNGPSKRDVIMGVE